MSIRTAVASTFVAVSTLAMSAAAQGRDFTPYLIANRSTEIALARTAAPKNISDSATILVMTRKGLEEAVRGSNGFTCFVLRSFSAGLNDPGFWDPRGRAPHCLNAAATQSVLPGIRKRVEWVLAGRTTSEIATLTDRAYVTREFPVPAPGAMAYMTSHQQMIGTPATHWMPHLMFYFDGNVPASIWGAGGFSAPVIDGSDDLPHPRVRTLLIPVRQWSDGTPAMSGTN
ncbi:MAG TPA: hypothetical protein VGM20_05955 [Gemmatimonadales bacterium]|jgi:hypothetical protein